MKTPIIIDTMNKHCYDILPPVSKSFEVLYAPIIEVKTNVLGNKYYLYEPIITTDVSPILFTTPPNITLLQLILGNTADEEKIYIPSDPPVPISRLDSYSELRLQSVDIGSAISAYMINNKPYYVSSFQITINNSLSTTVENRFYIVTIENGIVDQKTISVLYGFGGGNEPGLSASSTQPEGVIIIDIGGKPYIVKAITIYNGTTYAPAITISELDPVSKNIVSSKIYGVEGSAVIGINTHDYRIYTIGSNGEVYVYGIDTGTVTLYGVTTLDIQVPQPYVLIYYDGYLGGLSVQNTSPSPILYTCSVSGNTMRCYDAGYQFFTYQFKYGDLYMVTDYFGAFIGIVYNGYAYGTYNQSPPTSQEGCLFPTVMLYGGDALLYVNNGIYLYEPKLMPWDKCCDIPEIGYTCMSGPVNVSEVDVPITDTGSAPPVTEYETLSISEVTNPYIKAQLVSKTVSIQRIC